jgi:hypothetical protein
MRVFWIFCFSLLATIQVPAADVWRPVRGGILYGISDLALIEHSAEKSTFLIVHDNKRINEPHAAIITVSGQKPVGYEPVEWAPDSDLIDLESLSRVPNEPMTYLAMTSRGAAYVVRLKLPEKKIEVLEKFKIPDVDEKSNFEGISLLRFGSRTLIAWAHRGEDQNDPGVIYFGELDRPNKKVKDVQNVEVRAPWPTQHTRHISDMKLDETGVVWIASTCDPGDDGPFDSAIYLAGVFYEDAGKFKFRKSTNMIRMRTLPDHKVEAFELVPGVGGVIFGTDDENYGGWVLYNW